MISAASYMANGPLGSTIGMTVLPPAITIWINGIDITAKLYTGAAGTPIVTVSEVVHGTSTAQLAFVEESAPAGSALDIQVGHEVIVEHKTRRIFGGSIADFSVENPGSSDAIFHRLSCKDYSAELEKKRVAQSYEDTGSPVTQTIGDVISQVFADFLSTSGLALGTIEDGPLLQKANFNYVRASDALVQLARLTGGGFIWTVDFFRMLSFRARTSLPAPWSVDDVQTDIHGNVDTEKSLENYRNKQIVRGGNAETELRTDTFESDGKQRTFVLRLPVGKKPVIRVNTVAVSPSAIGLKGVDEDTIGITWLFEIDSPDVSKKTAPTLGDDIEIDYIGLFPIVVIRESKAEQTSRDAIEIGDGIYEELDVDEELDLPTARQKGDALIDKHARIPARIRFETDRQGEIKPGQLLTVKLTKLDLDADYIIESVEISMVGDDLRYGIAANDGRETLEWLEFYRSIQRAPFLVRANEKLILGSQITEQLSFTDIVDIDLSDTRIAYNVDEYTAFLVPRAIGRKLRASAGDPIAGGEADGPEIKTAAIV